MTKTVQKEPEPEYKRLLRQTKRYIITLAFDIDRRAKIQAQEEGVTVQAVMRRALYEYLQRNQR